MTHYFGHDYPDMYPAYPSQYGQSYPFSSDVQALTYHHSRYDYVDPPTASGAHGMSFGESNTRTDRSAESYARAKSRPDDFARKEKESESYGDNHKNEKPVNLNDPLRDARPGSLAPCALEMTTRMDTTDSVHEFLNKEVYAYKHRTLVMYESVRKLGRFYVENGHVLLDRNEREEDVINGMSRIWQLGEGLITCRRQEADKLVYISMYQVSGTSYERLSRNECEHRILTDPLWKDTRLKYCVDYV